MYNTYVIYIYVYIYRDRYKDNISKSQGGINNPNVIYIGV